MLPQGTVKNKRTGKPGKRGDKNYSPQLAAIAETLFKNQRDFMLKYNIRYTAFRELYFLYTRFKNSNNGSLPYHLYSYLGSTGNYPALYQRLDVLKEKGLIKSSNRLYYPTDKAIKELNELLRSA